MADQAVETPIASGERTDPDVSVVVDEKPTLPENKHVTESLFGETVSDAELRGEEGTPTPPPAGEEKPVTPTTGRCKANRSTTTGFGGAETTASGICPVGCIA